MCSAVVVAAARHAVWGTRWPSSKSCGISNLTRAHSLLMLQGAMGMSCAMPQGYRLLESKPTRTPQGVPQCRNQASRWWWSWPGHVAWTRYGACLWWPCSSAPPGQPDLGRMSGLGPLSHACRNACLCWPRSACPSVCPSPPPCKCCTVSAGHQEG